MKKFSISLLLVFLIILSSCGGKVTDTTASDTLPLETESEDTVTDTTASDTLPLETESEETVTDTTVSDTLPLETEPEETECAHTQTHTVTRDQISNIFTERVEQKICLDCSEIVEEKLIPATKSLKILAIGNSFSDDATAYLRNILNAAGAEEVIVGHAYIGGCSLDKHWTMAQSGEAAYSYFKYTSSGKTTVTSSLKDMITDEEWDIITLQQVSQDSGMPATYKKLQALIDFVLDNCSNDDVELNFHMTWAYEQTSNHLGFANYKNDQMTMYKAITDTAQSVVLKNDNIAKILPVGTAIQNLRTSYFGDTLTRDGYHLSLDVGRYTAALTWACAITGVSPNQIKWVPAAYTDILEDLSPIIEAVENAIATPFEVTESKIKEKHVLTLEDRFTEAGLDINDYELLDWEPKLLYHWNASTSINMGKSTSMPQFTASKKFTKDELPIGTVIVVDKGYQYRPDGWQKINEPLSGTRPSTTTAYFTVVDESWWGDFNYRAFNLSKVTGKEPATEEDIKHFYIYVPKKQGE